jgi:hypothetical protein
VCQIPDYVTSLVGGAGFYIATRSLISLPPPTVLLPASRADAFEAFIASLRALDGSDLPHTAAWVALTHSRGASDWLRGLHCLSSTEPCFGCHSRVSDWVTWTRTIDTGCHQLVFLFGCHSRVSDAVIYWCFDCKITL